MKTWLITTENAEFQVIQALKNNRVKRHKSQELFIEGTESIKQACAAGLPLTRLITHDLKQLSGWGKALIAQNPEARVIELSFELYKKLCDREEPSELLVTAKMPLWRLGQLALSDRPLVLVFDRPSDYGNFGSLVRSADALGVEAILVVGHAIDVYDPKVIRASLGAVLHVQIVQINSMNELTEWAAGQKSRNGLLLVGTDSTGEVSLLEQKLTRPLALILGNEAKGMSVALKELCDVVVRIPLVGAVNSLNVSCAGSILLWEIFRGESQAPK